MGIFTDDYEIVRDEDIVTLRLLRDVHDSDVISSIAETLTRYVAKRSKHGKMTLLIDLLQCHEFRPQHVISTVGILIHEKDIIMQHIQASACLLHVTASMEALGKMFKSMYTPVHPFAIFDNGADAHKFLRANSDLTFSYACRE